MANKEAIAYIGTYTKVESEGIYRLHIDKKTGEITQNKLAGKMDNPTYLKLTDDQKYLYSVAKDGENGGVAAFAVKEDGSLDYLNQEVQAGNPPCYVDASKDGAFVVSANYHLGTIVAYPTEKNGALKAPSSSVQHVGTGPNKERQEKAHAHFAGFTPDEKFVITCDLGTDYVTTYALNDGVLEKVSDLKVKGGSGPRNLVFHPNDKIAYIMTEMAADVVVAAYDEATGALTEVQSIASLPADFSGENKGSAIHISNDGRFLYVSNRGQDAVVTFAIDAEGKLSLAATTPVEGVGPRDFDLDPSGEILLVSNENTNNVTVFGVNKETGALTLLQKDIHVPEPVCVKFINE
ncbi:lactonase family protein [Listeria newyorkensis]|uniref:Lactonase family protein n=1 Tax=Listeria newyorkensis TaxID=1497681 RepID=A0A841Z0H9_9LIST|nr:lactonase family protein [Listeria newyorkensis]MBC1459115.1 lactonase family protein [Listeria newyorkensis]